MWPVPHLSKANSLAIEGERSTPVQAIILIDSNMPRLEDCDERCQKNTKILCQHRFQYPVEIEYCNNSIFSGVSDSDITLYFINVILSKAHKFLFETGQKSAFVIVTHDEDFIRDVKREWIRRKQLMNPHLRLEFYGTHMSVIFWTFTIYIVVETIRVQKKSGLTRIRDCESVISRINDLLSQLA